MTPEQRRAGLAIVIASSIAMPFEGLRQEAYKDPVGITTICYGSTAGVKMGDRRSLAECTAMLSKEMAAAVREVDSCRPGLPIGVLSAFSDAAYNLGSTIACDPSHSTAARKLQAGDLRGACNELPKWNKGHIGGVAVALPGLTKRRAREQEICLKDVT